jgi:hypothetical protein
MLMQYTKRFHVVITNVQKYYFLHLIDLFVCLFPVEFDSLNVWLQTSQFQRSVQFSFAERACQLPRKL